MDLLFLDTHDCLKYDSCPYVNAFWKNFLWIETCDDVKDIWFVIVLQLVYIILGGTVEYIMPSIDQTTRVTNLFMTGKIIMFYFQFRGSD